MFSITRPVGMFAEAFMFGFAVALGWFAAVMALSVVLV